MAGRARAWGQRKQNKAAPVDCGSSGWRLEQGMAWQARVSLFVPPVSRGRFDSVSPEEPRAKPQGCRWSTRESISLRACGTDRNLPEGLGQ